jgi:hypothetical protein
MLLCIIADDLDPSWMASVYMHWSVICFFAKGSIINRVPMVLIQEHFMHAIMQRYCIICVCLVVHIETGLCVISAGEANPLVALSSVS